EDLKAFAGKEVFYVVAPEGRVLLKTVAGMSDAEQALFEEKQRTRERVEVAVDRIRLDEQQVLDMRKVDASDSGVRCGPKAANLGQLKKMYPDQVVEGLVIPFGIFRAHMDQTMPGQQLSYWTFLNNAFAKAAKMRIDGMTEDKIETYVLEQLELLREGIQSMQFSDEFRSDLLQQFEQVFKRPIGEVPVFVRSDTNMEDLKEFTGAGLNLTLFNVVTPESIFEGIKKVWASPYTERSFKWRQRYLINPENVFPSILIIPSVDVDFSGVIITKGITNDVAEDLTVAISRGAGGAVDGQAAESYLLEAGGQQQLLTPAREPGYRRLPVSGGTSQHMATFDQPIASATNLQTIRDFADRVEQTFPEATGTEPAAAYDIEFGFANDKLWLFQIRPFVESKNVWEIAGAETLPYQTEATTDKSGNSWWLSLLVIVLLGGAIIWWALSRNKRQILE
ncbi:MAG: PEP/pyruvate-binding domain-containing protein, partial [Bacteroidota bacterium]